MNPYLSPISGKPLTKNGDYLASDLGEKYPIVNNIPRFVKSDNYTANFGLEWSIHSKLQLDSYSNTTISLDRLNRCLGTSIKNLRDSNVLEAGCGAGRFTELLVNAGACVHAIDMSIAVESNHANIGDRENYTIAQADILAIPFENNAFDYVICLGVLQHLPSPEAGMLALWQKVKPGGWLIIDHYTQSFARMTKVGQLIARPILKRLSPARGKKITDNLVRFFFPIQWAIRKTKVVRLIMSRVSPIFFYYHIYPELDKAQHYEFSQLDTFDGLTDYYKHLRNGSQIKEFLTLLGAENISVSRNLRVGNGIEARCQKPSIIETKIAQ